MKKLLSLFFFTLILCVISQAQTRHYAGEVSLGGISSLNEHFGAGFDIQTSHGTNVGSGSYVAFGTGLLADSRFDPDNVLIPIYLKFKQYFTTISDFKPYLAMSAGATLNLKNKITPYFSPEFGVKYKQIGLFVRVMMGNTAYHYTIHLPENIKTYVGENRRLLSAGLNYSFER